MLSYQIDKNGDTFRATCPELKRLSPVTGNTEREAHANLAHAIRVYHGGELEAFKEEPSNG